MLQCPLKEPALANSTRTYSTSITAPTGAVLDAYARQFSTAVRTAYAQEERAIRSKAQGTKAVRKAHVQAQFNLTSRQANAVLVEADGKRAGILELYKVQVEDLQGRLRRRLGKLKRAVDLLARHKDGKVFRMSLTRARQVRADVFRHKTKIDSIKLRIAQLKTLMASGHTSLTFGTKKVLRARAQSALTEKELKAWRRDWDLARNGQFLVLGSKDETAGCQGCVATAHDDGSFTLRIRLPDAQGGGHATLPGVRFAYGAEQLRHALAQQVLRAGSKSALLGAARAAAEDAGKLSPPLADGEKRMPVKISQKAIQGGIAITWRFMRQVDDSWRISFATDVAPAPMVTSRLLGAIGVDINSGFISVAETDRFGNILSAVNILCPETGRSAGQRAAARGDAVKQVIARCRVSGKPLVLEALDFKAKKRDLDGRSEERSRKLSALAYKALHDLFSARALEAGVDVITVDPAYTSTQGQVRYAAQRGWTVHMAAAGVISRRGMGISEAAPVSGTHCVPVGVIAVEWTIPEEIARSDVSLRWPLLHRSLRRTIASYFRERRRAAQPGAARSGCLREPKVAGGIPAPNRALRPTTKR